MTIARHYVMIAKAGAGDELQSALDKLADAVRPLPGCSGVEMLRDIKNADRFVFIEKWDSVEAHAAAGPQLPKDVLAPMMAALEGRPDGSFLEYGMTL